MRFYSTNNTKHFVDLHEAVIHSLPPDNGLYMPETIQPFDDDFWKTWQDLSFSELGYKIAKQIFQNAIPNEDLREIVEGAITFPAPVVQLDATTHVLELFQGPTLAFKDFGARFMARTMRYLTKKNTETLTVLVATSGDTGGAVASAFHQVEGTEVIILYPKGGISALQEKQLTTLGGNITALEVEGSFDDCQSMVKAAFLDDELRQTRHLTSANSINISRLVPQSFYYFEAFRQLEQAGNLDKNEEVVFVIPSGNFGNLTAGLLAQKLGLPIRHFVAATNVNDVVPRYLADGNYEPLASVATVSNAMDVGNPSNFARMQELFGQNWDAMRESISGLAFDDEETCAEIKRVAEQLKYQMCPHTAVASLAANLWHEAMPTSQNILLATAHPSKFLPTMEEQLGKGSVKIPERLACLVDKEKRSIQIAAKAEALKEFLLQHHSS